MSGLYIFAVTARERPRGNGAGGALCRVAETGSGGTADETGQFRRKARSGTAAPGHIVADLSSAKFSFRMTDAEKQAAAEWYTAQLRKIAETVQHGAYAMLVLDELLSCITCGFLPEQLVLDFLEKPSGGAGGCDYRA